jgi:replication initiation protein RepC
MQALSTYIPQPPAGRGGGRVGSDRLREAYALGCEFAGLEEGTDRYALLLLVKKAGNLVGVSPAMVRLLDYYLAFTRDCDWEEGGRPIVYQSLARTAMDLGVTERQIQKLENALFEAGVIGWNDCGNHRRFGQRCPETGRILYAFGVDLTPLAYLRATLEEKLHEKRLRDEAWREAKRQISWLRRQVRGLLAEWSQREEGDEEVIASFAARYEEIAIEVRAHLSLEAVRALLARHEALHSELMSTMGVGDVEVSKTSQQPSPTKTTRQRSCRREQKFVHKQPTTQSLKDSCSRDDAGFQESVAEPPAPTDLISSAGLGHVTLRMAVAAAGERLRLYLPKDPGWSDLSEAAYRLRADFGVSQASWAEACGVLGREGAALCLLVTDRAAERPENPVARPAAYFRAMVNRARAGELRLHSSVFGLLDHDASEPTVGRQGVVPF